MHLTHRHTVDGYIYASSTSIYQRHNTHEHMLLGMFEYSQAGMRNQYLHLPLTPST